MKNINLFTILSFIQFFVLSFITYLKPLERVATADIIWTIFLLGNLIILVIFICSDLIYSKIEEVK